jgi:hypothetical protein
MTIKSPLGAIGAIVVLIQAISAGALFAIRSQIALQWILVILIAIVTLAFTTLVIWLVVHLTHRDPAYLFNPQDIDPSVHRAIYASQSDKIEVELEDKKPS